MTEAEILGRSCYCGGAMKETATLGVRHSDARCSWWFKTIAVARPRCRDCPHQPFNAAPTKEHTA